MDLMTLILVASTAGLAPWWQGIDVTEDDLKGWGVSERGVDALTERLRRADLEDAMERCLGVVDAGLIGLGQDSPVPDGRYVPAFREYGRPSSQAWLICIAALQLVAESKDSRFREQLELLHPILTRSLGGGGESSHGFQLRDALIRATPRAYQAAVLSHMSAPAFVEAWRQERMQAQPPVEMRVRQSVRTAAVTTAFGDLIQGEWTPDVLALYDDPDTRVRRGVLLRVPAHWMPAEAHDALVARLVDGDGVVRDMAERRLLAVPERTPQLALPLLRFLARDDLDDRARQMAEEALRARGYTAESGPSGIRAVPLDDRRPVIELPPE